MGETDPNARKYAASTKLYLNCASCRDLFLRESDGSLSALVQVKDASDFHPAYAKINSVNGNILSLNVHSTDIQKLGAETQVEYIDLACRLNAAHPFIDTTKIMTKVDLVHKGTQNGLNWDFKGKDVIVGIVDIGFQPDHPTFFNKDGSAYRVKRWWMQGNTAGTPPSGFNYGSLLSTESNIKGEKDDDGTHGTHVAGIAGGSGFTSPNLKYAGMAPESDLVFVSIKYWNDSLGGSAYGDYLAANPKIIDGYNYIFAYAASVQKPASLNLSWGMHTGPHDGTSLFDKAVESLTGPGKIVVGANGNDAGNEMHCMASLAGDTQYTFALDHSRNEQLKENVYCDFWGSPNKAIGLNVTLFDTLGNQLLSTPFSYSTGAGMYKKLFSNGTDSLYLTLVPVASYINNQKPEILMMAETNNSAKLRMRVGLTGQGLVHGWNSGQTYRWTRGRFTNAAKGNDHSSDPKYVTGTQAYSLGENGGTGKATISVGSYIARKEWYSADTQYHAENWLQVGGISGFSSRGPATDGRIKPDISAPGQLIASAVNYRTVAPWQKDYITLKSQFDGKTQYWILFSGTSMAAPHVCGIVALMLQANPSLTPYDVRRILRATAIRDSLTGFEDSNIHRGYGKVNAFEAVKMARLENSVLKGKLLEAVVYPNPAADVLNFAFGLPLAHKTNLQVFDMGGRLLNEYSILQGSSHFEISMKSYSSGAYFYTISSENSKSSGKFIRL